MLRLVSAFLVFGLELYALATLWNHRPRPRRIVRWTALVVFVPVLGALHWLRTRRRLAAGYG